MIRSFITKNQRDWDVNLLKLGFALRTAVHEITGYSPAYLNFGRNSFIFGKMYKNYDDVQGSSSLEVIDTSHLAAHVKLLNEICSQVRSHLAKAYEQSSNRYNLRHRPLTLTVGQIVWKKNH